MFASTMKNTRKCSACKAAFTVDYRNNQRHAYCPQGSCQRARRRQEQRLRRALEKSRQLLTDALEGSRRLQRASPSLDAVFSAQSPVIIGLISTLTDSRSREDIEKTIRSLWQRGQSILDQINPSAVKKRPKTEQKAQSVP